MIGKSIHTLLTTDATFAALTGMRVYPNTVPQNAAFPYAVYTIIGTTPMNQKDGVSPLDEIFVQLDLYSKLYETSGAMAEQARTVLDGHRGAVAMVNIDQCIFEGQQDGDFDPQLMVYWVSQDYRFRIKRQGSAPTTIQFFTETFTNVVDNTVTVTVNGGVLPSDEAAIVVFVNGFYTSNFSVAGSDIEIGFDIAETDIVTVRFLISGSEVQPFIQTFPPPNSGNSVTVTENGGVLPVDDAAITVFLNGQQTVEWSKSGSDIVFDFPLTAFDTVTVWFLIY